jgi:CHASE2 domain-containing sensor protein
MPLTQTHFQGDETIAFEWDPILFVNLVLCIVIVILGYLCYKKSGETLPLYIGGAFGLFGISHATTLMGFKVPLTIPLIIIRTLAYLLIVYALYRYLRSSIIQKETRQAWVDYFKDETGDEEKTG